jgi:hypothetical protein
MSDHNPSLSTFILDAGYALIGCQLVEEALKSYIINCNGIVAVSLRNTIPFNYAEKEIEDLSLDRLTGHFKRFNSNAELISKLQKLPKERNYCAHRAFVSAIHKKDNEGLDDDVARIHALAESAWGCWQDLSVELAEVEERLRSLREK